MTTLKTRRDYQTVTLEKAAQAAEDIAVELEAAGLHEDALAAGRLQTRLNENRAKLERELAAAERASGTEARIEQATGYRQRNGSWEAWCLAHECWEASTNDGDHTRADDQR